MEIWKDVVNYEGVYQISNNGDLKRLANTAGKNRERLIKPVNTKKGYLRYALTYKGIEKRILAHVVVASSFLQKSENHTQVNHINGIKNDNRVENLEWCTQSENQKHSYYTLNIDHCKKSLKDSDVLNIIELIKNGLMLMDIAKKYNVKKSVIYGIAHNRTYKRIQRDAIHIKGKYNIKPALKASNLEHPQ